MQNFSISSLTFECRTGEHADNFLNVLPYREWLWFYIDEKSQGEGVNLSLDDAKLLKEFLEEFISEHSN